MGWYGMGWVSVLSSVVEERVKSEGEGKAMLSLMSRLNSRNGTLTNHSHTSSCSCNGYSRSESMPITMKRHLMLCSAAATPPESAEVTNK
jgi:hypothetical protein